MKWPESKSRSVEIKSSLWPQQPPEQAVKLHATLNWEKNLNHSNMLQLLS